MLDVFGKTLEDVTASDLARLRGVAEGWYVEYKRTTLDSERIAKTLCSFANQYGGWLFLGVDELPDHSGPGGFPGIPIAERATTEQRIRQAAQSHCSRAPFFETHFVVGPCSDPPIAADRFVAIVRVPPSDDVPHVHSSGRIYRRIGSSSEPTAENDRSMLDHLLDRQKRRDAAIRRFTETRPPLREDDPAAHIHVYLVTRREGEYSSRRSIEFAEFVEQLKTGNGQVFDNFYTTHDGYAARAVGRELPNRPHTTLRYALDGWAHISLPIDQFPATQSNDPRLRHLQHLREFEAPHALVGSNILDLTSSIFSLTTAMSHYVQLLKRSGLEGVPAFYCVAIEGMWRNIPYIDMASFPAYALQHGVAHLDQKLIVWPAGDGFHSLARLDWKQNKTADADFVGFPQAAAIFSTVVSLMGIDAGYLSKNYTELVAALKRRLTPPRK